jgi:hypothetical protein
MVQKKKHNIENENIFEEPSPQYGFIFRSEEEKLREDVFRPDLEKLQLFTRMLRRNTILNKAIITHTK